MTSDLAANFGNSPATKPTKQAALGFRLEVRVPRVNLAFTRYCHHQYCMVYCIKGVVGGWPYIAQWACNSIAIGQALHVGGGGGGIKEEKHPNKKVVKE